MKILTKWDKGSYSVDKINKKSTMASSSPPGRFLITRLFNPAHMGIINYVKETRGELKHVSWPTRKQAVTYSCSNSDFFGIALYLDLFDYFSQGVKILSLIYRIGILSNF